MRHRQNGWLNLDRARSMRRDPTPTESRMWAHLRNRQLGVRFRRQEPIGSYIVDFVCMERRLVLELDGESHVDSSRDEARDADLRRWGFSVIRVNDSDVYEDEQAVVELIWNAIQSLPLQRGS